MDKLPLTHWVAARQCLAAPAAAVAGGLTPQRDAANSAR
jgi:hypothetical protein